MNRTFRSRFLTSNPGVREIIRTAEKVLETDVGLLIVGESGTGKDYLARAIHECGHRKSGPFVQVDCAAIPDDLFESELFGHSKGSFTGASTDRPGRLELAHGGTLVLEEIGDLPPVLQPKLLRVVQDRQVTRLGDARSRTIDLRFVATTNMPIDSMIERGAFRSDLYYRLNVVRLELPPLRNRPEDIEPLAERFARDASVRYGRSISGIDPEARDLLRIYTWPGNLRELRNLIERAIIMETGTTLSAASLPKEGFVSARELVASGAEKNQTLAALEKRYIREILRRTGSNYSRAAEILGINRKTLLEKRRRYGLDEEKTEEFDV